MRCLPVAGGVHGEGRRRTWAIGAGNTWCGALAEWAREKSVRSA